MRKEGRKEGRSRFHARDGGPGDSRLFSFRVGDAPIWIIFGVALVVLLQPVTIGASTPMICQHPALAGTNPPEIYLYFNTERLSGCPHPSRCDPRPPCPPGVTGGCCESDKWVCCPNGPADCGAQGVDPDNPLSCKCAPYNPNDPDCWSYDEQAFVRSVVGAAHTWSEYGGMNRVFRFAGINVPGKLNRADMQSHEVLIKPDYFFATPVNNYKNPGACIASTYGHCGNLVQFTLYNSTCKPNIRPWTAGWNSTQVSFRSVALHELGHVLGLIDYFGDPSVMNGRHGSDTNFRMIWPSDINAVRSDPTYGYGLNQGYSLRHRVSTDGVNWSARSDTTYRIVHSPSAAFGWVNESTGWCGRPPCPAIVVARVASEGNGTSIRLVRTNGYQSEYDQAYFTKATYFPPVVAFGAGKFLLVFVNADAEGTQPPDARKLQYGGSYNGRSWWWSGEITVGGEVLRTASRPALFFNPDENRFHLLFAKFVADNDDVSGCLCSADYRDDGTGAWSWGSYQCAPECAQYADERDNIYRTDVGTAGDCRAGGVCLFSFPDVAGQFSLQSFWGDYVPPPWDFLWKIRGDYQTGDYPNTGPSISWVGSLNKYILMFKGFWYPLNTMRSRKTDCENCAWYDYRTLSQGATAGVSTVFENTGAGSVSVWYGSK